MPATITSRADQSSAASRRSSQAVFLPRRRTMPSARPNCRKSRRTSAPFPALNQKIAGRAKVSRGSKASVLVVGMIDVIVEAANEHVPVAPLNITDFGGGGGAGRHPVAGHFVPAAQDRTGRAAKVVVEAAAEARREHGRGGLSGGGDEGGAAGRQLPAGDRVKAAPVEARVVEDVLVDEVVEASRDHEEGERVAAVVPEGGTGGAGREPPAGNHAPAGPTRVTVGLCAVVLDAVGGVPHEHVQEAA